MGWKHELRLDDLPARTPLEAFCRRCGRSGFHTPQALLDRPGFAGAYLDQVEAGLTCDKPGCGGAVTLYEVHAASAEAFQGGLP